MEYNHAVRITIARLHFSITACSPASFVEAVNGVGARSDFFRIRNMADSVEHVIRRDLYHGSTASLGGGSQIAGSYMVQFIAKFGIVFCLVHCRISGTSSQ